MKKEARIMKKANVNKQMERIKAKKRLNAGAVSLRGKAKKEVLGNEKKVST
jgi:hypothetical protein